MKKIITIIMLITVVSTFAQDPIKLKENQIDQTNILHKDTSNEEKFGALNSRKGFGVGDGNLAGDGFSYLPGYTGGKPVVGSFFGLTSVFGNHGSVTGNAAVYFTMSDADRGWILQVNSGGSITNVASVDGSGRATFAPATASGHAVALGQLSSTNVTSATTLSLSATELSSFYTFTGTVSVYTLPAVATSTGKRIVIINAGTGSITLNSNAGGADIWEGGTNTTTTNIMSTLTLTLYCDGLKWRIIE